MFEAMINDLKLLNYSKETIKNYILWNRLFLEFVKKKPFNVVNSDLDKYQIFLMQKGRKPRTIRLMQNALRFYYRNVLKRNVFSDIKRPKIPKNINIIATVDEIYRMIDCCSNLKHKLLIIFFYSTGCRLSETLNVKIDNIFLDKKNCLIRSGKGKKDRFVSLSDKFIELYHLYIEEYNPIKYLFFGNDKFTKYSKKSAQLIVKKISRKAGVKINMHPHIIRKCYTTHLVDKGINIDVVSRNLGHSDVRTTKDCYLYNKTPTCNHLVNPMDV